MNGKRRQIFLRLIFLPAFETRFHTDRQNEMLENRKARPRCRDRAVLRSPET